jgi:BirA family biotin operon repressor/biotin-[acetyl-CoA-carboxylase] ligase
MSAAPHALAGAAAIQAALRALWPGFTLEVLAEIDSTNTELMRRARAGRTAPVLLMARQQTAGRGRLGRPWQSQPDASLTFSLGLPLAPPDWSGLSLAVGVSVAESLHPHVRLKWPNDLWLSDASGERKLGGILIETASLGALHYAVIGVGLNLAPREAAGLSTPPGWLQELLPGVDALQALARVAAPLAQTVLAFQALGFAPFQDRFNARDVLQGREVSVADGRGGTLHGSAHGVTGTGALLVHTAAGMKQITSSEVSVRPLHRRADPPA